MFYANIKADAWSQNGRKAAYYDGRVYYLSAENGEQGVYSMAEDGGEARLEFPAEDIRALWVGTEGFLYSGFAGMGENDNGPYRRFRLFSRENRESEACDLMASVLEREDESWRRLFEKPADCVWAIYRDEDGVAYVSSVVIDRGCDPRLDMFALYDGRLLVAEDLTTLANQRFKVKRGWEGGLNLYARRDMLMQHPWVTLAPKQRFYMDKVFGLYDNAPTVQGLAMGPERPFLSDYDYRHKLWGHWLCRFENTRATLASQRAAVSYDLETDEARLLTRFRFREQLFFTYNRPDDVLLITERGWWPRQLGRLTGYDHAGEALYRLDTETGRRAQMLWLRRGDAFVYVDDTRAISARGTTLNMYDIAGDEAIFLESRTLGHAIVAHANKAEVAGRWLFLYGFNPDSQRDELLEKVWLG